VGVCAPQYAGAESARRLEMLDGLSDILAQGAKSRIGTGFTAMLP
jgi:hypothetical protein